ncbi:MAG: YkgJ family cysteine cluster protein [Elusimicrobiota bacterium]
MKIEFKCRLCGACCRQEGYVFIEKKEAQEIASFMGMPENDFLKRFCHSYEGRLRLKGDYNKPCILLKEGKCLVYEKRPSQCRTFPYWGENLNMPKRMKDISLFCRGLKLNGEE